MHETRALILIFRHRQRRLTAFTDWPHLEEGLAGAAGASSKPLASSAELAFIFFSGLADRSEYVQPPEALPNLVRFLRSSSAMSSVSAKGSCAGRESLPDTPLVRLRKAGEVHSPGVGRGSGRGGGVVLMGEECSESAEEPSSADSLASADVSTFNTLQSCGPCLTLSCQQTMWCGVMCAPSLDYL